MEVDNELEQELFILDVTEMIVELMNASGVTRSELAHRLGTTKGHVTQILSGKRNLTLRTLSDVFLALGHRFLPSSMPATTPYADYLAARPDGGLTLNRAAVPLEVAVRTPDIEQLPAARPRKPAKSSGRHHATSQVKAS